MRTAVIGRTEILYRSAIELAERNHEIPLFVTCPAEPHYKRTVDDFRELAADLGAEFLKTANINSEPSQDTLRSHDCDVAVSVNWKTLIKPETMDIFPHGMINCHAGDLPRFRGNAATNWAIIAGENEVVYTLHKMTAELDAGPILMQKSMPIGEDTYINDIYEFGEDNVPVMFGDLVDALEAGSIEPQSQSDDPSDILRCYPRHPEDSRLQWHESAEHLHRIVRASAEPLFGAYTFIDEGVLRVWRSHTESPEFEYLGTPGQVAERRPSTGNVAVITGDGFLVLEKIQIEDGKKTDATDIITSNRTRLGVDMTDSVQSMKRSVEKFSRY